VCTCAVYVHPHLHLSEGLRRQMTQENRSGRHVLRDVGIRFLYVWGIWFNLCRALHVCVCMCMCVSASLAHFACGKCVFLCVCMRTCMHGHTHTHTHTHTHACEHT
jgi:hypothetical protein